MTLTITFDLEDNRRSRDQEARFLPMTHRFLDFAAEHGVACTFFVVGEIARAEPALVRRIAEEGHELALHGLRHVVLEQVGQRQLRAELQEGRALLEDTGQAPVTGFRAPIFSLTPVTAWAVEELAGAGFQYSSSVLPAANPLHGWPGAPREPWRWAGGPVELPCPVVGPGRARLPFLGGVYLRYLPMRVVCRSLAGLGDRVVAWSYIHPYDIDADEPFFVMPHAGWLTSRIVHARRSATLTRLKAVTDAAGGPGRPLGEIAQDLASRTDLPSMPAQ